MQSIVQNCACELKRTSASCLEKKKMKKIMENTILHSNFKKNRDEKSTVCLLCTDYKNYYGLLIKI